LDFIVYTGATTEIGPGREFGVSDTVVMALMEKYLQKGHTLWMDNWYSSPQLYDHLHKNRTNTCGTVRRNSKGMPEFSKKLGKGQTDSRSADKMMAIVVYADHTTFNHHETDRKDGQTNRTANSEA
jgi:hypothetical protein